MTPDPKMPRLLVGVDFDEASASALEMAGSLAAAWNADITVFHAVEAEMPAYFTAAEMDALEAERKQSQTAVADELRTFAAQRVRGAVAPVIGEGPPQDAILRMAPSFDLIVLGTHRRHGPRRWWLGSVAEAIVRHSSRPVLVVPAGAAVPTRVPAPTILAAGSDTAAAGAWIDLLRAALGGQVVRSVDIEHCAADRVHNADLIVLAMSGDHHSQFGVIGQVLKECVHPVLFIPSVG